MHKYGIDEHGVDAILDRQGGVCAICDSPEAGGRWATFAVDHDHATGELRGLLCQPCNVGIGQFSDDPSRLRRAADYLELPSLAVW